MANYIETLADIQKNHSPEMAVMPYADKIYEIDLNTRKIETPEYLSVLKDHKAENIYFSVNRYFDYMDLANTVCIVEYKNKNGTGIYPVPYYDIVSGKGSLENRTPDKIIFPWCLDGHATSAEGDIQYAIQFYKVDANGKKILYSLNTIPTTSQIMYGMDIKAEEWEKYDLDADFADYILSELNKVSQKDMFWVEYV